MMASLASLHQESTQLADYIQEIRRYSEGLDFTVGKEWVGSSLKLYSSKIDRELERGGCDMTISLKDNKMVQRLMVRFAGLLYVLGLSGRKKGNISIHIEVDLNPPLRSALCR